MGNADFYIGLICAVGMFPADALTKLKLVADSMSNKVPPNSSDPNRIEVEMDPNYRPPFRIQGNLEIPVLLLVIAQFGGIVWLGLVSINKLKAMIKRSKHGASLV